MECFEISSKVNFRVFSEARAEVTGERTVWPVSSRKMEGEKVVEGEREGFFLVESGGIPELVVKVKNCF